MLRACLLLFYRGRREGLDLEGIGLGLEGPVGVSERARSSMGVGGFMLKGRVILYVGQTSEGRISRSISFLGMIKSPLW